MFSTIQSNQSLEHLVLEQLFATNGEQGFSAVKAIQVANQEGQKIFTITKDNYQEIIPQLNLASSAIADIESAAKAGYTITTHQNRISLNGYTGEGYIILNDTGNGAWMINGGMYGGYMVWHTAVYISTILLIVDLSTIAISGSLPLGISQFINSIFGGLGIGSNLLDLAFRYNGTAECLNYLIIAFVMEVFIALASVWLRPWAGWFINWFAVGLHEVIKYNAEEYKCKK